MRRFFDIFKDERGATAIEYGLILAMVFLAMLIGLTSLSGANSNLWGYIANQVTGA